MNNRIEIVNWRSHGADESYCYVGVYGANEATTAQQEIQKEVDENYEWEQQERDAEEREDWNHVIYYNDEILIEDGDIREHNGRKFRVRIEEVTDGCIHCGMLHAPEQGTLGYFCEPEEGKDVDSN